MRDQLHYRGDQTRFDPDHVMGPDMFGAFYRATAAEYDPAADATLLTLVPIPPADLQARWVGRLQRAVSTMRVSQLFAELRP